MSVVKVICMLMTVMLLSGCGRTYYTEEAAAAAAVHPAEPVGIHIRDSAQACVLYCPDNGALLYGHDIHEKRAIASITKIMTAVVALENCNNPDMIVTVTEAMYAEGSSMYLRAGEKLRLIEIVKGMLVVSGNDAANAVALAVGGSTENFAALMNRKAAAIGMKNTHFVTPSGLDDEQHYSTAYDMALLCAYAMDIPEFRDIVSNKRVAVNYVYPEGKQSVLYNHNDLLSRCEGCIGIKTGYTRKAGRTLTSCAERNGARLIVVTLSDGNDWNDHCNLYDYGFTLVKRVCLAAKDKKILIPSADNNIGEAVLSPEKDIYATVMNGEESRIEERITAPDLIFPSDEKHQPAGRIEYLLDGKVIAEGKLFVRDN